MQDISQEIGPIIFLVIVFLLLAFFILLILVRYRSLGKQSKLEKEHLHLQFQQQLSLVQLEIQEETLNNVSQEIHDNVGQILSGVKMQLNVMLVTGKMNITTLEEIKDRTGNAMNELRNISKNLNSGWMQNLDLEDTIFRELEYLNKGETTRFTLEVNGSAHINNKTKIILFRIIQEACHNVIKHSNASKAIVKMCYDKEFLILEISDNGNGFEIEPEYSGIGLSNMKKRSEIIGATFLIISNPVNGSTIRIQLKLS